MGDGSIGMGVYKLVDKIAYCTECDTILTHEAGYWGCPKCKMRLYGIPGYVPAPVVCLCCETPYPAGDRRCPVCGASRDED